MTGRGAYLFHLCAWGLPVLLLQLAVLRWRHRNLGAVLRGTVGPVLAFSAYLTLADHVAISSGVWTFGAGKHLGLLIGAVPVEEALFFLFTNAMVVLGWALFTGQRYTGGMIPPRKGGPLGAAWSAYVTWKVRRSFRGLWLRGTLPDASTPLVVYANHANFWDGFVVELLAKRQGWDVYCLMEERQLRRYPFLARLGAFSLRRGDAGSALESLRFAKRLLQQRGAAVLIFPEGKLGPPGPIAPLERGVEVLARASGAQCLPLAIRYAFFEGERPDILVEAGAVHPPGPLEVFGANLEALVDRLSRVRTLDGFEQIIHGRPGLGTV